MEDVYQHSSDGSNGFLKHKAAHQ